MDANPPLTTTAPRAVDWPSVWQLGASAAAGFGLWGLAAALGLLGVMELARSGLASVEATALFLMASGMALTGALALPSAAYALARLRRASLPWPGWLNLTTVRRSIYLLPLVVLLGYGISTLPALSWLLLPPLHLLALGIPILWLLWFGGRGLNVGSPQRAWGVFGAGLVLAPLLILLLELVAVLAILLLVALFLASQPELVRELMQLAESLRAADLNPEQISRLMAPYLANPRVPFTLLIFFSGLVPLIEELLKPIGVWFLSGRNLTPAQGFLAGLLSGAGYALFENLALSSQAEMWAFAVTARAGTSLLHMVTAAISGWALALAWREGRYLRLVLSYLAVMLIHGLWNGLSLLAFASALELDMAARARALLLPLGQLAPIGLGVLTLATFVLLAVFNRRLRSRQI